MQNLSNTSEINCADHIAYNVSNRLGAGKDYLIQTKQGKTEVNKGNVLRRIQGRAAMKINTVTFEGSDMLQLFQKRCSRQSEYQDFLFGL